MENLLTYILQVNLLLALIFLGYYFLLKGLTFYALNRVYFVVGSLYAFAYPFIDIKSWFTRNEVMQTVLLPELVPTFDSPATSTSQITLLDFIITVVAILAVLFVFKLLIQLFSLLRIHLHSKKSTWQSYIFRNVVFPIVPFSFFNKIYIHKEQHQETELQDIFAHEIVHVRGHHTVDILLFEIILVVCWYNPFVWLMRKAVRQNLEFLTDQQVLNKGVDKQTYQYSLLHVTRQGVAVGMSNHFNFKTLKKRIMMMNKKRSSKLELSKYAFLLPVFLIAGMSFTVSKAENNIDKIVEKSQQTTVISEPLKVIMQDEVSELLKNTIGTDVIAIDTNNQEKEYPLLAPDFDRKELEGKNLYFTIDGKLVSLDEFLEFPRKEIDAVDIYKDKEEIRKKIGKENSEGLFVVTSKKRIENKVSIVSDTTKKIKIKTDFLSRLKSKSEIDVNKKLVFIYDDKVISKDEFYRIPETELFEIRLGSGNSILLGKYRNQISNAEDYDGFVSANSSAHLAKLKENSKNVLIVIDGIEKPIGYDLSQLNPNDIYSMTIWKDKESTDRYGDKGKNGVIIITTKKRVTSSALKNEDHSSIVSLLQGNKIDVGDDASLKDKNITFSTAIKPLFIVDDKEQDADFTMASIEDNDIESINVLKGENATALYGDKGKDGVIMVTTKKSTKKKINSMINDAVNREIQSERQKNETPLYADRSKGFSVAHRYGSDVQQENKILDNRGSSTWKNDYYSSLNNFLEKNKSQIDFSKGYVLIIDNKLASEKDLKSINKEYVKTVSATDIIGNKDISVDFSNKLAGILRLTTTTNKSETVKSMSASVEGKGKSYKLVIDDNSNHPIIKIQ